MTPLVSIIVPTHNNERTLGGALESLIAQTYRTIEIIVVDDFSTDSTAAIAQAYAERDSRISVIASDFDDPQRVDPSTGRNVNAGWSARMAGAKQARGELISFQDADDASLLNRIEVQVRLLQEYDAMHILTGWQAYDEALVGTLLDLSPYEPIRPSRTPDELFRLSQQTKGIAQKFLPGLSRRIPFRYKRMRVLHHLFFGSLAPFPGAGNSPLFRREVIERVGFRPLKERVWPSFMGRGADRDFHFQVAETFRNSYTFELPLYLWRTERTATSDVPSVIVT